MGAASGVRVRRRNREPSKSRAHAPAPRGEGLLGGRPGARPHAARHGYRRTDARGDRDLGRGRAHRLATDRSRMTRWAIASTLLLAVAACQRTTTRTPHQMANGEVFYTDSNTEP